MPEDLLMKNTKGKINEPEKKGGAGKV